MFAFAQSSDTWSAGLPDLCPSRAMFGGALFELLDFVLFVCHVGSAGIGPHSLCSSVKYTCVRPSVCEQFLLPCYCSRLAECCSETSVRQLREGERAGCACCLACTCSVGNLVATAGVLLCCTDAVALFALRNMRCVCHPAETIVAHLESEKAHSIDAVLGGI